MAEARFRTRTSDGRIQLDSDLPGFFFLRKERISVGIYYTIYKAPAEAAFVAFKPVNSNHWMACSTGIGDIGEYSVKLSSGSSYTTGEVDVYLFTSYAKAPLPSVIDPVRFNLRDSAGNLSFVGLLPPLKITTVVAGSVPVTSNSKGHIEGGYSKDVNLPANRTYAIMFSTFLPSLQYGGYQNSYMFEIVVHLNDTTGLFRARQPKHKFTDTPDGSGTVLTYGCSYISHMIADVTYL